MAEAAGAGGFMMLARLETGGLVKPKGPPAPSDDLVFSPFIGMSPPSLLGRGGLKQLTETPQTPTLEAPFSPARGQPKGLIPAAAAEVPPDQPPPILPPEPTVIPDPPAPPIIVVVVTPTIESPPPGPSPPETRPAPAVAVAQNLTVTGLAAPLAAVPEPGTWAMLVLGFGAIGAAVRRRRRDRPVAEGCC